MIRRWLRRLWPLVDWRRAAVLEARHRGAAVMLDESMRRSNAFLALPYRLGDSDGTRITEPEDIGHDAETSRGAVPICPATGARDCTCYVVVPETGEPMRSWAKIRNHCDRSEPSDGEAAEPRTIVVDRDVLMRRAREASDAGADYLPPWTGEGL